MAETRIPAYMLLLGLVPALASAEVQDVNILPYSPYSGQSLTVQLKVWLHCAFIDDDAGPPDHDLYIDDDRIELYVPIVPICIDPPLPGLRNHEYPLGELSPGEYELVVYGIDSYRDPVFPATPDDAYWTRVETFEVRGTPAPVPALETAGLGILGMIMLLIARLRLRRDRSRPGTAG